MTPGFAHFVLSSLRSFDRTNEIQDRNAINQSSKINNYENANSARTVQHSMRGEADRHATFVGKEKQLPETLQRTTTMAHSHDVTQPQETTV